MKAEEKKLLYTFVKTSTDYFCGYTTQEQIPVFTDLEEHSAVSAKAAAPLQRALSDGRFESGEYAAAARNGGGLAGEELQKLYEEIRTCTGCRLCSQRKNAVPGEGPAQFSAFDAEIDVMVIGEGPGADEDVQGRPFVGKAGQLLDKMLSAISLFRTKNCYITNVVKCRPPNNRDPEPDESAACRRFLEAQIRLIRPKAVLAVGRIAMQNLLGTGEGITKLHGRFLEYGGIPFMATYHPSALLRNVNLKRPAWEDLKLFRARLAELKNN